MFGFNLDVDNLKDNWKHIIVGVGVNSVFWYLLFFVFGRHLIVDFEFFIPMILSVPLAILSFQLSVLFSSFYHLVFNSVELRKEFDVEKEKEDELSVDYTTLYLKNGLVLSICFLSLFTLIEYHCDFLKTFSDFVVYFFSCLTILVVFSMVVFFIKELIISFKKPNEEKKVDM